MHEFSICKNLVDLLLAEVGKQPGDQVRVKTVRLIVGRYHQIVPENLEFAFEVLVRDTPAAGALLAMTFTPIVTECLDCRRRGEITPPLYVCAQCGGGRLEIVSGKEMILESMEIHEHE